ncbi:MAG: hypothetical protein KC442_06435 [Thermomicrobiales bacterium]|nr:hypothetical protein [Thermomicrobiales bacterium]
MDETQTATRRPARLPGRALLASAIGGLLLAAAPATHARRRRRKRRSQNSSTANGHGVGGPGGAGGAGGNVVVNIP